MTPKETETVYTEACRAKRITPIIEEGRMWHDTLKDYAADDVREALRLWWSSTERDSKGDLKSAWMPAPGDLILILMRIQRQRAAANVERQDVVHFKCSLCTYRYTSFPPSGTTPARTCPRCKVDMIVYGRIA